MTAVERAIQRRDWETLALYLLLGVVRAAEKLPPETVLELVEILAGPERRVDRDDG